VSAPREAAPEEAAECHRLDSDLALTVCHTTDCLREGVVDRDEWERIVLDAVAIYERGCAPLSQGGRRRQGTRTA